MAESFPDVARVLIVRRGIKNPLFEVQAADFVMWHLHWRFRPDLPRLPIMGPLRDPTGASPLATGMVSGLIAAVFLRIAGKPAPQVWCVAIDLWCVENIQCNPPRLPLLIPFPTQGPEPP